MKSKSNNINNIKERVVRELEDFEPQHIFECGQCFRWNIEEDGSYTGVALGRVINVRKDGNSIIFSNTGKEEFEKVWWNYFDLGRDYGEIKRHLGAKDKVMKEATSFGKGIRILKQDPWETLISFIISANNNIPRIKKAIELLSSRYGREIGEYKERKYYSFPDADTLANLSVEDLSACNTGYRAPYILNTARMVADNPEMLKLTKDLSREDCREVMMTFSGVGPKVANCILFFAMDKMDSFPVDVWVKRVMEYFYFKEDTAPAKIQKYAEKKYGDYAGFAQQYLFYYARELGIGKKK